MMRNHFWKRFIIWFYKYNIRVSAESAIQICIAKRKYIAHTWIFSSRDSNKYNSYDKSAVLAWRNSIYVLGFRNLDICRNCTSFITIN